MTQSFDRRDFLKTAGAAAALGTPLAAFAQGANVAVNWYPGQIGASLKKSVLDTYPDRAAVQIAEMYDNARFTQMQANRARPTNDVALFIDVLMPLIVRSGLLAKLDPQAIANLQRVDPALGNWDGFSVPMAYGAWGICYNAKRVSRPITSWKDLLRDDLKGRVSAPNITFNSSVYTLDALAGLAGGGLRQPEEGYKAMRQIRTSGPGLWEQENVAVGWLKTEEVWASPYYSGSVLGLRQDKDVPEMRFVIPSEGAYFVPFNVTKLANGPNPAAADRFINHIFSAQAQGAWAQVGLSRPANRDVAVPKDVTETTPMASALKRVDWNFFGENRSAIVARWNEVVNR